ncbi:MAG: class I SAM-dependent methyltransferase [Candidatus Njordarchaeales archaeon]
MFKDLEKELWEYIIKSLERLAKFYEIGNNLVSFFTIDTLRRITLRYAPKLGKVLEIGPGPGNLTRKLLKNFDLVICLEPSPILATYLLSQYGDAEKLSVLLGVAEKIPIKANSLDVIFCSFSFRDFFDKREFLREAYRCLKKNGCLIIVDAHGGSGLVKKVFTTYVRILGEIMSRILRSKKNLLLGLSDSMLRMRNPTYYLSLGLRTGFKRGILRNFLWGTAFILMLKK